MLHQVKSEEHQRAEEEAKHRADSGDGEVHYYGRRPDEDEDDETDHGTSE